MNNLVKAHSPKRHIQSFKYAFAGILHALLTEANFRIHVVATVVVVSLGVYFRITNLEWSIIIIVTAMVLTAEMVNTVVEVIMNHMFKEYSEVAKISKDLGAGFVLISAIAAICIFTFIFGERLRSLYYAIDTASMHIDEKSLYEIRHENKNIRPKNSTSKLYPDSSGSTCESSEECIVSGCNSEICGHKISEKLSSICVIPEEPLPLELGYECSCVEHKCQWSK